MMKCSLQRQTQTKDILVDFMRMARWKMLLLDGFYGLRYGLCLRTRRDVRPSSSASLLGVVLRVLRHSSLASGVHVVRVRTSTMSSTLLYTSQP